MFLMSFYDHVCLKLKDEPRPEEILFMLHGLKAICLFQSSEYWLAMFALVK